jgi:voltage-gated potassium channel
MTRSEAVTPEAKKRVVNRSEVEREIWAEELLDRLTPAMSALSVVFVLVIIGESLAASGTSLSVGLAVAGWLIWLIFVAEFLARLIVAPRTAEFLKRNWWQVGFLLLPFLRIVRLFWTFRVLRTGRILSSAVRTSRSAGRALSSRVGWLAVVSAITALASSQLLYEFEIFDRYGDALHAAALATITGEPLAKPDGFAKILDVALAAYSVVVFAALAATLGAYFLENQDAESSPSTTPSV